MTKHAFAAWRDAGWRTRGLRTQARPRVDGDWDYRELMPDEFGRYRWSAPSVAPAAYWRAEGYRVCPTCAARIYGENYHEHLI